MFLSKSSSGIYYLYYKDDNGRRQKVSTRAHHKTDALKFLTTFRIDLEKRNKPLVFSAFMLKFLEFAKPNLRPGTISLYEKTRDLFVTAMGDISIDRITSYQWDMYKAIRLKQVSPVTVNIELRTLRSVLSKAHRWGFISNNPFSMQPLCMVPERYPVYFTHDEFKIYFNAIPQQWF